MGAAQREAALMARKTAMVAVTALFLSGVLLPEILAFATEGYSSLSNYLSEQGALGAPYRDIINNFGFLPVGLLVSLLVCLLFLQFPVYTLVRAGLICYLGVAIGYFGAFFFPCDLGCPAVGSERQGIHNLAGVIEYVGGIGGLFLIYFGLRRKNHELSAAITLMAAIAVTVGFVLMAQPSLSDYRGAAQRLADYTLFAWLAYASLVRHSRA